MPAQRKVSHRQTEILISFMEMHMKFAKGQLSHQRGPLGKRATEVLWDQLSGKLNCCGSGITKSTREWKLYWNNIKYKVRNKARKRRRHMSGTASGPAWEGSFTSVERRILAILGSENVLGEESILDNCSDTTNLAQRVSSPPTLPRPWSPMEDVKVSSPIHVPVPMPDHTPPFQHAAPPTCTNNRQSLLDKPDWAHDLEERHVATQERIAASLESLLDIQREVLNLLNQRLPFFKTG